jgi:hypothetical protein
MSLDNTSQPSVKYCADQVSTAVGIQATGAE